MSQAAAAAERGPHTTPPSPVFVGKVLSAAAIVIGLVLLLALLWSAREVLLLLFGGMLLAILLRYCASQLCRWLPLRERMVLTIVVALLLGLAALTGWLVAPGIGEELREVRHGLAGSLQDVREQVEQTKFGELLVASLPDLDEQSVGEMWSHVGGMSATALGALAAVVIVVFAGLFFAFSPRLYTHGALRLLPRPRRQRALEVMHAITVTLRWWLLGQLFSMVFLLLSTWLFLALIGVPMAFTLGLLTGLLTFVPYIGALVAVIPIAVVAFAAGPGTGLLAISGYLVIQTIEGDVLVPLLYQRLVRIPAALTLAAQALMASLIGLVGVAMATPLLAAVIVAVRMLYVEDVLGDDFDDAAVAERHEPQARAGEKGGKSGGGGRRSRGKSGKD